VFQVEFDMFKRFYLGGGWNPLFGSAAESSDKRRSKFEMGLVVSWLEPEERIRRTVRAFEGTIVPEELQIDGQLFAYDMAHSSTEPFVRVTTFFGTPRRHDGYLDVGWGFRAVGVKSRPHRAVDIVDFEWGEGHANWAIWQSRDLLNHVQLSAGVGGGQLLDYDRRVDYRYVLPDAGLEARFVVDRGGFHTITGDVRGAVPVFLTGLDTGTRRYRAGGSLGYEVIFLAINDQPLSLRLEGAADYRTDLPERAPRWESTATTAMRFSFWVPGRTGEVVAEPSGRKNRSSPRATP
jgi:hypothetical protein